MSEGAEPPKSRISLRGSASTISLVELLTLIEQNGHTGTLKVQTSDGHTWLHFYGNHVYLPKGGSRGAARLGALLVRAGKITGRQLVKALQVQREEGHRERIGDLLVRLRLVTRADIDQVIQNQFQEQICDLLFEENSYFEFKAGLLPVGFLNAQGEVLALGFDTRSILMEASRRQDEWRQIRRRVPSPRTIYRPLPRSKQAWQVDERGQVHSDVGRLDSAEEDRLLQPWKSAGALYEQNPVDGTRTVDEIVAGSGISAFQSMGILANLRQEGWIQPLSAEEIEERVVGYLRRNRQGMAFKLYEWANEANHLRPTASRLDKVLLRKEHIGAQRFRTRTSSERAIQILSRLLRRGAPFRYLAREGECVVEVYFTPNYLRLHLQGPRRTHSTLRYLRRRRAIDDAGVEAAKARAQQRGRSLDRTLLDDGFVTRQQWVRAIKDKAVSGMFGVFGWEEPFVEVQGGVLTPPAPEEIKHGLVCEIPLDAELRGSLRRDLLRWKVLLQAIPSPDVVLRVTKQRPSGAPRRAHDLFDGRRTVGELIRLARVAPLELVRFVYECLNTKRIARLSDRDHYEAVQRAVDAGHLDEAVTFCKSAIACGYAPKLYQQRLRELSEQLVADQGEQSLARQTFEGELKSFALPEILQLLNQGQRSGTLKLSDGVLEKAYYLDKGMLYVLKLEVDEAEDEVYELLEEDRTQTGLNLNAILNRTGSVDESEVGELELARIKEDVFANFLWEEAHFQFRHNVLPKEIREDSERSTKLSLRLQGLLIQGMAVMAEWDDMRAILRGGAAVLRFRNKQALGHALHGSLGETAKLFNGRHSLREIARRCTENRLQLYRQARDLMSRGDLVLAGVKSAAGRIPGANALASGRVPQLHSARRPRVDLEGTEGEMDLGGMGDSMAEVEVFDLEDSDL